MKKLNKHQKSINVGRFVQTESGDVVFVDNKEKVWTQDNIADLIKAYRDYLNFKTTADYYEKNLR
jgi:alkyl sulfatase BDS1-like metallo-beta-lactamase superfamily hydrolase